ncbi:MAG: haloalkane dehalogenase [Chitinivibrionales bacterium]|nr:haloalkane dehalogenase [Chitinivibrionales bacterium]
MANPKKQDWAHFPYESRYINVHGSDMHYIEQGEGDPVLFLHGNPTSSYLWRNIIPHVSPHARCIAPDLIGMGKSDRPDLDYTYADHYKYTTGFIDKMDLHNITLVIHDWGSGLGFNYAMNHEGTIKGIAFMEAIIRTWTWEAFPPDARMPFKLMRTPGIGWVMISVMNGFVEQMLPMATMRELSEEEMNAYRAPFPTIASRKPVRMWPNQIPISGKPAQTHHIVSEYNRKLTRSQLPKLLFYADPGAIVDSATVAWCKANLPNLETVYLGKASHFVQEDHPDKIGREIARWYREISASDGQDTVKERVDLKEGV